MKPISDKEVGEYWKIATTVFQDGPYKQMLINSIAKAVHERARLHDKGPWAPRPIHVCHALKDFGIDYDSFNELSHA